MAFLKPLWRIISSRFALYLLRNQASIADRWISDNHSWDLGVRRCQFGQEFSSWILLIDILNSIVIGNSLDKVSWHIDSLRRFSSKLISFIYPIIIS